MLTDSATGEVTRSVSAMATTYHALRQPRSLFFEMLPAEIRIEIYELVFTTNDTADVDLMEAIAPNKALLLTCRQIEGEAKLIYRKAYRDFWRTSKFFLNVSGRQEPDRPRCSENAKNLSHT